jgi:tetratricopeptide (TPR) repeat protein
VQCWYLLSMEPDSARRTAGRGTVPATRVTGKKSALPPAEPWPKFGTSEFNRRALGSGRNWLDSRGRDAGSLVGMWDLTGDESLLAEAAEKFPDDPRVCMAMIQRATRDPKQAMRWIERLIAADPDNSGGIYLKAWALENSGDHAGAIAALRKANGILTGPGDYRHERDSTLRLAAASCGIPERDVALIALQKCREDDLSRLVFQSASRAVRQEMDAAKALGQEDVMVEMGRLGLDTADSLAFRAGTLGNESAANGLERSVLSRLPEDTVVYGNGMPAGKLKALAMERCGEIYRGRNEVKTEEDALLLAVTDAVVIEYSEHFLDRGEAASLAWLKEQAKPEKQAGSARQANMPELPVAHRP